VLGALEGDVGVQTVKSPRTHHPDEMESAHRRGAEGIRGTAICATEEGVDIAGA